MFFRPSLPLFFLFTCNLTDATYCFTDATHCPTCATDWNQNKLFATPLGGGLSGRLAGPIQNTDAGRVGRQLPPVSCPTGPDRAVPDTTLPLTNPVHGAIHYTPTRQTCTKFFHLGFHSKRAFRRRPKGLVLFAFRALGGPKSGSVCDRFRSHTRATQTGHQGIEERDQDKGSQQKWWKKMRPREIMQQMA